MKKKNDTALSRKRKGPLLDLACHPAAEKIIRTVCEGLLPEGEGPVLELLAGPRSLIPEPCRNGPVFGVGTSMDELRRNNAFTDRVLTDLHADPCLPFRDNAFAASVLFFGLESLGDSGTVLSEVARVLKPGAPFLAAFSSATDPECPNPDWKLMDDQERLSFMSSCFEEVEAFGRVSAFGTKKRYRSEASRKRQPVRERPPVWVLYAYKRKEETDLEIPWGCLPKREEARDDPHRCPYCGEPLKKWEVPHSPFEIDCWYDTDVLCICFNDECPYFKRGWEWMWTKMRRNVSYRHMYNPTTGKTGPIPVPTYDALRDGILEDEGASSRKWAEGRSREEGSNP